MVDGVEKKEQKEWKYFQLSEYKCASLVSLPPCPPCRVGPALGRAWSGAPRPLPILRLTRASVDTGPSCPQGSRTSSLPRRSASSAPVSGSSASASAPRQRLACSRSTARRGTSCAVFSTAVEA
jgi:hypothetical protein